MSTRLYVHRVDPKLLPFSIVHCTTLGHKSVCWILPGMVAKPYKIPSLLIAHCPKSRFVRPSSRGRMSCIRNVFSVGSSTRIHIRQTCSKIPSGKARVTHALGESCLNQNIRTCYSVEEHNGARPKSYHNSANMTFNWSGGKEEIYKVYLSAIVICLCGCAYTLVLELIIVSR